MALHCSPTAIQQIKKMQAKRIEGGKPPAPGLRIGIRGGGCNGFGYVFEWCDEAPRATDQVFAFPDGSDGEVKIFCDPKSLIYLDNTTLDYVTGLMGHGFKFENPNAKGACGCGESVQF